MSGVPRPRWRPAGSYNISLLLCWQQAQAAVLYFRCLGSFRLDGAMKAKEPIGIGMEIRGHVYLLRYWVNEVGGTDYLAIAQWAANEALPFDFADAERFIDAVDCLRCAGK